MYKNCIITQAKDQGERLKDWVLYHYEEGFDTFLYFDDYSEDNSIEILNDIREKYGINILIGYSDGFGNKKTRQEMKNSESYGGDISINYRIIRSYNKGLEIVSHQNSNAKCALLDVDEFLVTNNFKKVTDLLSEIFEEKNTEHIYVHSFDIDDDFKIEDWYTTQESTAYRWDYEYRESSPYKNRGKSISTPKKISEIPQGPNYVHILRDVEDEEFQKTVDYRNYDNLRIHHFRKPCLNKDFKFCKDLTLVEKMSKIKEKYNGVTYEI